LVDTGQGLHESLQHALQLRNDPRELYSVVSFLVTQRHKEFGISRALGASTPSVLLGVIYSGLRAVLAGLVAGFLLCILLNGSSSNGLKEA
jgi:ABC-type antimicrobial peptide transport system permease subunit